MNRRTFFQAAAATIIGLLGTKVKEPEKPKAVIGADWGHGTSVTYWTLTTTDSNCPPLYVWEGLWKNEPDLYT